MRHTHIERDGRSLCGRGDQFSGDPTCSNCLRIAAPRYPIEPLIEKMKMGTGRVEAMRYLGVSGKSYQRYRDEGVTELVADRLAARAGFSVYEVWPEILEDAVASVQRECAAEDCAERFVPPIGRGRHQQYHSEACRQREKMRRYRARPHGRERNRQAAQRYRDSVVELLARRAARTAA